MALLRPQLQREDRNFHMLPASCCPYSHAQAMRCRPICSIVLHRASQALLVDRLSYSPIPAAGRYMCSFAEWLVWSGTLATSTGILAANLRPPQESLLQTCDLHRNPCCTPATSTGILAAHLSSMPIALPFSPQDLKMLSVRNGTGTRIMDESNLRRSCVVSEPTPSLPVLPSSTALSKLNFLRQ